MGRAGLKAVGAVLQERAPTRCPDAFQHLRATDKAFGIESEIVHRGGKRKERKKE